MPGPSTPLSPRSIVVPEIAAYGICFSVDYRFGIGAGVACIALALCHGETIVFDLATLPFGHCFVHLACGRVRLWVSPRDSRHVRVELGAVMAGSSERRMSRSTMQDTRSSFFSSYSRSSQDSSRFSKSCAVLPHSPQSCPGCRCPGEDSRASNGVALSPPPTQAMRPLPRDGDIFDAYNDLQNGATRPQGSSSPKRALLLYRRPFHCKGL